MVQAHRTSSNLLEPHQYRDSKVCRVLSHEFGVVRPNLLYPHRYRGNKVCRVLMHLFGVVPASSNFLKPYHYTDSKVCRVLSHEFGMVRLYRTFSIYIVTVLGQLHRQIFRIKTEPVSAGLCRFCFKISK